MMLRRTVFLFLIIFFIQSCYTSIPSIIKNPEVYDGQKVRVQGYVYASTGLNDVKVIYLGDYSGRFIIPVIANGHIPIKGEKIVISGIVNDQYAYKNRDTLLVIIESQKKRKKIFSKKGKYRYLSQKYYKPKQNPYILKN